MRRWYEVKKGYARSRCERLAHVWGALSTQWSSHECQSIAGNCRPFCRFCLSHGPPMTSLGVRAHPVHFRTFCQER
jgi:hypothetical protein